MGLVSLKPFLNIPIPASVSETNEVFGEAEGRYQECERRGMQAQKQAANYGEVRAGTVLHMPVLAEMSRQGSGLCRGFLQGL